MIFRLPFCLTSNHSTKKNIRQHHRHPPATPTNDAPGALLDEDTCQRPIRQHHRHPPATPTNDAPGALLEEDTCQRPIRQQHRHPPATPTPHRPGAPLADQGQPGAPPAHIPPQPRSRGARSAPSVAAGLACEKRLFSAKFTKKPFDNQ